MLPLQIDVLPDDSRALPKRINQGLNFTLLGQLAHELRQIEIIPDTAD